VRANSCAPSFICGELEDGGVQFIFKHDCVFVVIFLKFEHCSILVETAVEFAEDAVADFDPLLCFLEEIRPNVYNVRVLLPADTLAVLCEVDCHTGKVR